MTATLPTRAKAVAEAVAAEHGLSVQTLLSRTRVKHVAVPRFDLMWRLRRLRDLNGQTQFSYPAIGLMLGVDHTSVIHGVRRWAEITGAGEPDDLMCERADALDLIFRLEDMIARAKVRVCAIDQQLSRPEVA